MERRPWGEWDHPDDRALSTAEIIEEGKKVGSSCYASFSNMKKLKSVAGNPPLPQQRHAISRRHSETWNVSPMRRHTSLPALSDAISSPQQHFTPSSASALSPASMRPHSSGRSPASVVSSTDMARDTLDVPGRLERLDSAHEGPGRRGSKKVLSSLPEGSVTPGIALPWSKNRTHLEGRHSPRKSSKASALSPRKSSKNSSTSGGATSAEEKLAGSSPTSRSGSKATPESPVSPANKVADIEAQDSPSDNVQVVKRSRSSNTLMRRASCPAVPSDSLGPLRKRSSIAKAMDAGVTVDSVDILFVMSCEERIPYSTLKSAYALFEEFAARPKDHPDIGDEPVSVSVTQVWRLSQTQFLKLIPRLPNIESTEDLPAGSWPMPFQRQSDSSISFKEFAIWLWSQAFSEDMVLTHEDRNFRDKTRESGLDAMEMDRYKQMFDRFAKPDRKHRHVIGPEDFGHCVSQLMKLPVGESLPPNRLKSLWMQADKDGNGVIDFMEFIEFYKRNFQSARSPSRA